MLDIPLITESADVRNAVFHALNSQNGLALGTVHPNIENLATYLEHHPAEAVLVDIDPNPSGILGTLGHMSQRFSQSRFVVLSGEFRSELVLEAMQAGVRHFLVKKTIPTDLVGSLKKLLMNGCGTLMATGRAISILSASGGSGATMLAINLAQELAILSEEPSLVIDLDFSYGAVANYLGLRGNFGIADVLNRTGEIDAQLIRTTAQSHSDRLHVLANPATIGQASTAPLPYDRLKEAIHAGKCAYKHVVVDAPRLPMEAAAHLLAMSDCTFLVFQLTVKDVAVVRRLLATLEGRASKGNGITLLANRYRKRYAMVRIKEAQDALNGRRILCLGNDYRNAVACINYGRMLADYAPRSALRKELKQLAQQVVRVLDEQAPHRAQASYGGRS